MTEKGEGRRLAALAMAMLVAACVPAAAGEKPDGKDAAEAVTETVTLTGWITDAACGPRNANPEGKACAEACARRGSKLMLYSGDRLYPLDDQEKALEHVGHEVKVTGVLRDDGIEVKTIETAHAS